MNKPHNYLHVANDYAQNFDFYIYGHLHIGLLSACQDTITVLVGQPILPILSVDRYYQYADTTLIPILVHPLHQVKAVLYLLT